MKVIATATIAQMALAITVDKAMDPNSMNPDSGNPPAPPVADSGNPMPDPPPAPPPVDCDQQRINCLNDPNPDGVLTPAQTCEEEYNDCVEAGPPPPPPQPEQDYQPDEVMLKEEPATAVPATAGPCGDQQNEYNNCIDRFDWVNFDWDGAGPDFIPCEEDEHALLECEFQTECPACVQVQPHTDTDCMEHEWHHDAKFHHCYSGEDTNSFEACLGELEALFGPPVVYDANHLPEEHHHPCDATCDDEAAKCHEDEEKHGMDSPEATNCWEGAHEKCDKCYSEMAPEEHHHPCDATCDDEAAKCHEDEEKHGMDSPEATNCWEGAHEKCEKCHSDMAATEGEGMPAMEGEGDGEPSAVVGGNSTMP